MLNEVTLYQISDFFFQIRRGAAYYFITTERVTSRTPDQYLTRLTLKAPDSFRKQPD